MAARGDKLSALGAATLPVRMITERWTADTADKERIAGLCKALGFEPNQVSAMHFTTSTAGIEVELTRRA